MAWGGLFIVGRVFGDTSSLINRQCPHVFALYNHLPPLRGATAATRKTISTLMKNLTPFPLRAALLALFSLCAVSSVLAHDFEVDGIYYDYCDDDYGNFTGSVAVTYKGVSPASYDGEYSGVVTIPDSVTYGGNTYPVSKIGFSTFQNCPELTKVLIGNSVTTIVWSAFGGCSSLQEVVIGNSVKEIGEYAFSGCTSLTSITIPKSVRSIGGGAFSGCTSLYNIDIHEGLTYLGRRVFDECQSLTSLTIPETLELVEYDTFMGCSNLLKLNWKAKRCNWPNGISDWPASIEYVQIDEQVEYIPRYFLSGTNIKSVIIPDSVTEIGYEAFQGCKQLESLTIGRSVKKMGHFRGCHNIKSLTWNAVNLDDIYDIIDDRSNIEQFIIGEDVERVPRGIIDGSKILSVAIPSSVTMIENGAFNSCSKLTSIVVEPGNQIYDSRDNCNGIVETATNTLIAGCKGTVIPNSVVVLGDLAFTNCTELTDITIPNSVISIGTISGGYNGYGTFSGCTGLAGIILPESVVLIGQQAFRNCSGLTDVQLPESLRVIGNWAFEDCKNLTKIIIPEGVTEIGNDAFGSCYNLYRVEAPNTLLIIGSEAFSGTKWYKNQPDGFVYVGKVLYHYKGTIADNTELLIPEDVISIADEAFYPYEYYDPELQTYVADDYEGLIGLTIPNNVRYIGEDAFDGHWCKNLKKIFIGNGVEEVRPSAFVNNANLTDVTISEGVKVIGEQMFAGCSSLKEVTIPNSVEEIRHRAFSVFYDGSYPDGPACTSLTTVTIGSGVKKIEEDAFSGCKALTDITCLATTPPTLEDVNCFDEDNYTEAILYVPKGTELSYMKAYGWKKFIHIVGITVNAGPSDVNGDGEVNIGDINNVVNAILNDITDEAYDVNGDGEINIADINVIVQNILGLN